MSYTPVLEFEVRPPRAKAPGQCRYIPVCFGEAITFFVEGKTAVPVCRLCKNAIVECEKELRRA